MQDVSEIKAGEIEAYYRTDPPQKLTELYRSRFEAMARLLRDHRSARLLDVGCGTGEFLSLLKARGFGHLAGCDLSAAAVAKAAAKGLDCFQGDVESAAFSLGPDRKFDAVVMGDILEHIFSPKRSLVRVSELLSDRGVLVLSVPNAGWWMNGILLTLFPRQVWMSSAFGSWVHCNQFTASSLRALLALAGFRMEALTGIAARSSIDFTIGRTDRWKRKAFLTVAKLVLLGTDRVARWRPAVFSPHLIVSAVKDENVPKEGDFWARVV